MGNVPIKVYRHTPDYVLISIGSIIHLCRVKECTTVVEGHGEQIPAEVAPTEHDRTCAEKKANHD